MRDFFSSSFFKIVATLLVLCFGIFLFSAVSGDGVSTNVSGSMFAGIQKSFSNVTVFVSNVFSRSFEYEDLVLENRELKNRVRELEDELRQSEFALEENEELKKMLDITETRPEFELEISEIVGRSLSDAVYTLTLDKGQNAGIEINDLVITEDGVVGFISHVGINFSNITTIYDENFKIGAIVSETRALGIVEGDLELSENGLIRLGYMDKNAEIEIGNTVETSGNSGTFPKGIVLGEVSEITFESQGVSKIAYLEPVVDLDDIHQVYIIKGF